MSKSPLVNTGEAARQLGIGASTLAHWRKDGKVKAAFVTVGGQARWDVDDLRRQVNALRDAGDLD